MSARLLFLVLMLLGARAPAADEPKPLLRAHSHNDYLHERPLLDALDQGFCSIEADIHLVEGQLLVAHELKQVRPERTLESLDLEPLRARVKANGGRVHRDGPPCTLLIDIKTDGTNTYPVLDAVLAKYADILTVHRDGATTQGAVDVVVDGARELIATQTVRYAAIDGNAKDLDSDSPVALMPWISMSWRSQFKWVGQGLMPDAERAKLREMVKQAHGKNRRIRFWGLPAPAALWPELYEAGVDLLNADDLPACRKFLLDREGR